MRTRSAIALAAAVALAATACSPAAQPPADDGAASPPPDDRPAITGEVTIALGAEPSTLDPQLRNDGNERAVNRNIYEGLLGRTPDGELIPVLAESMPEQVDDTTWRVRLRQGIVFHNGEPLDAAAVVHSVQRVLDPDLASEQVDFLAGLTGAEAVDDHTVDITTEAADPILPSRLYWMTIVPPEHSESAGFAENPVGTGPYTFVSWARGDRIVIEANPDYWGEATGAVERATFRFVEASGPRLSGLLAGEYDVIVNLLPEDVDRAPAHATVRGLEHPLMILNTFGGVTADVRVREALNLAIDREGLADFLFEGFGEPASHPFNPASFGYNHDLSPVAFDPDRAEELLEAAGAAGATIELVGTSGRWLKDRELIETVAGFWEAVGLTVDVRIFEFGEYLSRLFDRETRADVIFVSHSNELLDADLTMSTYFHMDGRGSSNQDAETTAMIVEARSETDFDRREQLYNEILQRSYDEHWFAFLLNVEDIWGISERIRWQPRVDFLVLLKEMELTS